MYPPANESVQKYQELATNAEGRKFGAMPPLRMDPKRVRAASVPAHDVNSVANQ
jgi:hypothetical protein